MKETFIACICRVFWAYRLMEVHFFAQLSVNADERILLREALIAADVFPPR